MLAQHVAKSARKGSDKPRQSGVVAQRPVHPANTREHLFQTSVAAEHRSPGAVERPHSSLAEIPVFSAGERDIRMPVALQTPRFPVQAKLSVGQVDDPLEHEADRVADSVMRRPAQGVSVAAGSPQISRKYSARHAEGKISVGAEAAAAEPPAIVHQVLRSPGQPLDSATRAFMEPRFGRDFSQVRIHTDATAAGSAKEIHARAYTAGNNLVFASGQYSPRSTAGQTLLAHELTHVAQQGGEAQLIQRAPANYPSNDPLPPQPDQRPDPWAAKTKPQPTQDDWIWILETFRRQSPQQFVETLAANEAFFYPMLKPYGFKGSWAKDQDYLNDFDAAVRKWGKSYEYSRISGRFLSQPKPKSREQQRYEYVKYLVRDMNRHGYLRSKVNSEIEDNGLMDDLVSHGFEKHGRWSNEKSEVYKFEAIVALNNWLDRYDAAHGNRRQTGANVPTEPDEDIEYYRAWLEGLGYVTSSFFAAAFASTASQFTNDPRKIAGAAGVGAAFEGVVFSVAGAYGGSYRPVVENKPASVEYPRYSGKQPIKPVADPAKVGAPPAPDRIPPPDPVVKDPTPVAKQAAKPTPPPGPSPPAKDPLPPTTKTTGKIPDAGVGAAPKETDPPAPPKAPAKALRATSKKNPPIDSKRQVAAKNRLEQTKADRSTASLEKASADQKLESAQGRLKEIEGRLKAVPESLRSKREAILKVKDLDERLDLVKEIRDSRHDWSNEEKEWLDQQVELLDAQLDVIGSGVGKKKQGENVRDSTIQEPVRQQELARASQSVADLVRSEGPNYRANRDKVNFDQVMGEVPWKALKAAQRKGALPLELNTDHIISVREIRDEVVKSGLLELHDKAKPAVKEQIERAIQGLGDERANLRRMEKQTNQNLKSDRSWWDIKYGEVERFYTPDMVNSERKGETIMRDHYKQVIKDLVTKFSK
jgi:hypothetical protein